MWRMNRGCKVRFSFGAFIVEIFGDFSTVCEICGINSFQYILTGKQRIGATQRPPICNGCSSFNAILKLNFSGEKVSKSVVLHVFLLISRYFDILSPVNPLFFYYVSSNVVIQPSMHLKCQKPDFKNHSHNSSTHNSCLPSLLISVMNIIRIYVLASPSPILIHLGQQERSPHCHTASCFVSTNKY